MGSQWKKGRTNWSQRERTMRKSEQRAKRGKGILGGFFSPEEGVGGRK